MQDRSKVMQTASRLDILREQGFMTDVTLICEGGIEIPAHRIVLSAACLYFQAKFACQKPEYSTSSAYVEDQKLEMKGIKDKPLKVILRYLYSGNFPIELQEDITNLKSILVTADFLQLPSLVTFCREMLVKSMSLNNCLELLDIPSSPNQKLDGMTKYAAENFHKLYYTTPYLSLQYEQLSFLIKCAKEHQNDDELIKGIVDWVKFDMDKRICHLLNLVQLIDVDKLSYSSLQSLSDDLLVRTSVDFARILLKSTIESIDTCRRLKSPPKLDYAPVLKLDFIVTESKNYNFNCTCHTYFYDDNLWSEPKVLSKVNEKKIVPLCKAGNFIYYFERNGKNLVSFYKIHYYVNYCEEIEYPYERYEIYSIVDKGGDLFLHIANRLIKYKPKEDQWSLICSNLPTSNSILVSCGEFVFCIVWENTNLIRVHTDSHSKVFCSLPENYKLSGQKVASCSNKLYFYEERKKYLVVYDIKNNDWQSTSLPNGVKQLGENWEFCFLRKMTPCLLFIDEFRLVWRYQPETDAWRRISTDSRYAAGLIEINNSE